MSGKIEGFCFSFRRNFLHLDVFYQEMRYEDIQQNKAFEFLGLLSDVGGFLGLLLGASVLTLCEWVDFLVLTIIGKLMPRSTTKHSRRGTSAAEQKGNVM